MQAQPKSHESLSTPVRVRVHPLTTIAGNRSGAMADSLTTRTTPDGNGDGNSSNPQNVAFFLVGFFFLLGLLGVLICRILKKKEYRCSIEADEELDKEEDEVEKDPEKGDLNETFSEDNADTVGQIVNYIMKNEANSDALKAMVQDSIEREGRPVTPTSPNSPTSPESPALTGLPPSAAKHTCNHLHTIGGIGGHKNICSRCNQKKWPLMRPSSSKKLDRRSLVAEVVVLSVGRFRVTKCDPKSSRDRRTLLITEPNGSVPPSPANADPPEHITGPKSQDKGGSAK